MVEIPDLEWSARISERKGLSVHCPHATVSTCPRYYQSLSLLGQAGSTPIDTVEDEKLKEFWQKSDLWPKTRELETAITFKDTRPSTFVQFCPEVAFDRFGYFASYLARYADEIDSDLAQTRLGKEGAAANDPSWSWATATAQHYTECPLYAVLALRNITPANSEQPWWHTHLTQIFVGVIVALVVGLLTKILG